MLPSCAICLPYSIGDLKRLRKIFGYEQRKVGVIGLHVLRFVRMSVDYRQSVIVILCRHFPGRIRAEYPHLIVKGRRVVHQLCLVQLFVQLLHDLVADFHADADVHGAVFRLVCRVCLQM